MAAAAAPTTANLTAEITTHLLSKSLSAHPTWLTQTFLPTTRASTPLPALKQTALFRLLASDITQTLQSTPSSVFPANIHDGTIKERRLPGPIPCQVIDVEDVGSSRWSQVEGLEAVGRGEGMKGREVIRVVPETAGGDDDQQPAASSGPHKLLLQDAKGTRVYGVEVAAVEGVGVGMSIGAKLVLRDVVVARGLLLLEPRNTQVLGGKIDVLHKAWREGRLERLREAAGMTGGR
ncbi:RecQ mediated genome instability protein Rmi1 [Saccharata proteae CBS 121410]|uniref:RecQ-mediated genome instability protein 1 n=1 Tax=Saccharata proteae CBS 121410 TaxID=1314787 RepID=A0A9P4HRD7_9PEZI|nr:RecQ mediated genome instability protein Rmi1 [Saccharata proteae CBS 121410]